MKDSCGEMHQLRGPRGLPPPHTHRKEPVPTEGQGLLSDVPGLSFGCLPVTGWVTLDKFLNYSEPESPYQALIAATCEDYPHCLNDRKLS